MSLADTTLFYQDQPNSHVMITYTERERLLENLAIFFNEGLKRDQLCIFGCVELTQEIIEQLSSKITDFEQNVKNDNFIMIDFKPYILPIMDHDMKPMEDLKELVAKNTQNRADKHVRFFGDLAAYLFEHKHYEESLFLEEWCQKNPIGGSIVCPYHFPVYDNTPYVHKGEVIKNHDKIIVS